MLTNTPHTWIFHFVNSVDEVTVVFCHPVGKYIMYSNKYRWRQAWICIDLETQRSTCCFNRLEQKTQIVQHNPNTTFLSFSKLHNTDLLNLTTLWLEMNWQLHKQVGKNKQMNGWICCVEQGSKKPYNAFQAGTQIPIHQDCIYETVELCTFCVVGNKMFEKHDSFNQHCRYKLDETIAFQHFWKWNVKKKPMVHSWDVFWESTPQPVPKHTPTLTKAHTESVLLVFVRACFGICWDVLSRVCFGVPRVWFGVGWGVLC